MTPTPDPIKTIEEMIVECLSVWDDADPKMPYQFLEHKIVKKLTQAINNELSKAMKSGFYAGQAMARVELDDCHKNWAKWNTPTPPIMKDR